MKLFFFCFILVLSSISFSQREKTHLVHFAYASHAVSGTEKSDLTAFLELVATKRISSVRILGFADDLGSDETNDKISLKRAENVEKLLLQLGIPSNKIRETKGKGSISLSQPNPNVDAERKANRRVEIIFEMNEEGSSVQETSGPLISEATKVGDLIKLDNILFEPGSHIMYPQSDYTLDRLLFYLKTYKSIHVMILGHICCQTDGQDGIDKETGLKNLSEARARAVYFYLVSHGIDKERLDFKGMKGNFPLGLGDQEDRRVEIQITKK